MGCRTTLRNMVLADPWPPLQNRTHSLSLPILAHKNSLIPGPSCGCKFNNNRARGDYHFSRRTNPLNCSHGEHPSSSEDAHESGPPQEAVLKAISEVSKTEGRVGQTTNMVIGGTVTDDSTNEWLTLDQKVNSYPTVRGFTAIGT